VGTGGIQPYLENERGDWVGLGDGRRDEGLVGERVVRAWHACDEAPGDGTWNGSEQQRESNGESSEGLAMSPPVWAIDDYSFVLAKALRCLSCLIRGISKHAFACKRGTWWGFVHGFVGY
jgi:hypothetical protein